MRPSHFHAPGLPNRLPNQPPVYDRQKVLQHDGATWSYAKLLKSMKEHHGEELRRAGKGKKSVVPVVPKRVNEGDE